MSRTSLKIVGASGQGIDSIGEILLKSLKRSGYCVLGYREYPSLIKGGHASYQIDISDDCIQSTETKVNVVVALNHHGLENNMADLKSGGSMIHFTPNWKFPSEHSALIEKNHLRVVELPVEQTLDSIKAKPILGNVLLAAFVWAMLGQDIELLKEMVGDRFKKKKDLLDLNMACIDAGFALKKDRNDLAIPLPKSVKKWKDHLLLTGSKAMGLGAIHAGVRLYAGYPMTPSSPLLSYIASVQNETGMVIKQAEDEITAAQMVTGAMHMGTRALTTTSGGGFDLMSETVSLNGIIENPTVFVLAQRPGPATGLPTWTAQADLLMAANTAHGEFARCVMSVSDATDAFYLMNDAFNLAEKFQTPVIVLTDKQIAEAVYTEPEYDLKRIKVIRGHVTDKKELKKLTSADRYDPNAENGISPRWLPGTEAATYNAQGDEHSADGSVDETAKNATEQIAKRMKKMYALKESLPDPELFMTQDAKKVGGTDIDLDVLLIGWGSTKSVALDILRTSENVHVGYLHFAYLWPLKTERLLELMKRAKRTILVEGNYQGQLGMLIKQECGVDIQDKILKYDGRPFFFDELSELIRTKLVVKS